MRDKAPDPVTTAVVEALEPLLGRHTSRRALAVACQRAGLEKANLGREDVAAVVDGLAPILRTLLGAASTQRVINQIRLQIKWERR